MINLRKRPLFPSFAGVALADILANSVAIIIIIIVVTLMIRHQQEQEKLEQTEDVSVLLSRNIATSVVMNALPTSPPVRLHHYNTSPLDVNPRHSIMPILELHDNYIQNYYTKKRYYRNTLLLQDNLLDAYLKRLSPQQKARIRIDVYGIRLFYIAMSILKSHGIRIGHWHFLGYPGNKAPGEDKTPGLQEATETDAQPSDKDETEEETDADKQADQEAATVAADDVAIPEQSELFFANRGTENYPYNDLALPNQGNAENPEDMLDLPGTSEATDPMREQSDAMFEALAQMMESGLSKEDPLASPSGIISRFRSADPSKIPTDSEQMQKMALFGANSSIDFYTLLPALFAFMEEAQNDADKKGISRLADYNFMRDILGLLQKLPPLSDPKRIAFFHKLSENIKNFPREENETLFLNRRITNEIYGRVLAMPVNQRIKRAFLMDDANQKNEYDLPGDRSVSSRLSLYPEIYKGLRQPLTEDSIILMPPEQNNPDEFRWRVVTVINPATSDFITAFVYSKVDETGDLLMMDSEVNGLKISNFQVKPRYPATPFRQEQWQLFFYSLIAMFFIFGLLHRLRKAG